MRLITSIRAAACPRCRAHGHGHNSGTATPGGPRRARSTRPAPRPAMHWRPAAARTGSTARQHRLPRRDSTPRATTGRGATPEDQQCIAAGRQGRPTGPSGKVPGRVVRQARPTGPSGRGARQCCGAGSPRPHSIGLIATSGPRAAGSAGARAGCTARARIASIQVQLLAAAAALASCRLAHSATRCQRRALLSRRTSRASAATRWLSRIRALARSSWSNITATSFASNVLFIGWCF